MYLVIKVVPLWRSPKIIMLFTSGRKMWNPILEDEDDLFLRDSTLNMFEAIFTVSVSFELGNVPFEKESAVAVIVVVVAVDVVAFFCNGKIDKLTSRIISSTDAIDIDINCV